MKAVQSALLCEAIAPAGAVFGRWEEAMPEVGERVVIFDREFEFTQHEVVRVELPSIVEVGPAIPWRSIQ
jgi:hypothetical protein